MTIFTNRDYIKIMFWGITLPMMIFFCVVPTIKTIARRCFGQFLGNYSKSYSISCFNIHLAFCCLSVFMTVAPCIFFASCCLRISFLVLLLIFFLIFSDFWSLSVFFEFLVKTYFTRIKMSVSTWFVFVKIRKYFCFFATSASFEYHCIRHGFLLIRKLCLEPIAAHTALGSSYCKRWYLTIASLIFLLSSISFGQWHQQKPWPGVPIDLSNASTQGIVGWWLMWEGCGSQIYDISGNGNTGTLVGDTKWVGGPRGPCLTFDGTGDYVIGPTSGILNITGEFTLCAWFCMNAIGTQGGLIEKYGWTPTVGGYILRVTSAGKLIGYTIANGTDFTTITGSTTLVATKWYFGAVSYDKQQLCLYLNGVSDATPISTTYSPTVNTKNLTIGADSFDFTPTINGLIDNVMIYNRALTAAEVQQHYMEPFPMSRPWFPFVMPSGQVIIILGN